MREIPVSHCFDELNNRFVIVYSRNMKFQTGLRGMYSPTFVENHSYTHVSHSDVDASALTDFPKLGELKSQNWRVNMVVYVV